MERQREDKWESSYRREADAIHVPEALMEKTRQAMERAMAEEAGIWFRSVPSEAFLPEELWQGEASRVDGREVHIGYDKEQELWCAAWEDDGTYYYAEAGEMEEKDFLKELKKIWNSL